METISINFQIPASWSESSDKQLRYVYQLIADNFTTDENQDFVFASLERHKGHRWK